MVFGEEEGVTRLVDSESIFQLCDSNSGRFRMLETETAELRAEISRITLKMEEDALVAKEALSSSMDLKELAQNITVQLQEVQHLKETLLNAIADLKGPSPAMAMLSSLALLGPAKSAPLVPSQMLPEGGVQYIACPFDSDALSVMKAELLVTMREEIGAQLRALTGSSNSNLCEFSGNSATFPSSHRSGSMVGLGLQRQRPLCDEELLGAKVAPPWESAHLNTAAEKGVGGSPFGLSRAVSSKYPNKQLSSSPKGALVSPALRDSPLNASRPLLSKFRCQQQSQQQQQRLEGLEHRGRSCQLSSGQVSSKQAAPVARSHSEPPSDEQRQLERLPQQCQLPQQAVPRHRSTVVSEPERTPTLEESSSPFQNRRCLLQEQRDRRHLTNRERASSYETMSSRRPSKLSLVACDPESRQNFEMEGTSCNDERVERACCHSSRTMTPTTPFVPPYRCNDWESKPNRLSGGASSSQSIPDAAVTQESAPKNTFLIPQLDSSLQIQSSAQVRSSAQPSVSGTKKVASRSTLVPAMESGLLASVPTVQPPVCYSSTSSTPTLPMTPSSSPYVPSRCGNRSPPRVQMASGSLRSTYRSGQGYRFTITCVAPAPSFRDSRGGSLAAPSRLVESSPPRVVAPRPVLMESAPPLPVRQIGVSSPVLSRRSIGSPWMPLQPHPPNAVSRT